jgi:thiamine pyrophosphate-dependent acetolactate synthase large subunit-like protein
MTVEDIKTAIRQLSEPERQKLAEWLTELEEQVWDAEMERDFSPGGRGQYLVKKINQQIDKAQFAPLEEGLPSRQEH